MNRRLDELTLQRGRLVERIAGQREALRRDIVPVAVALGKADSFAAKVHSMADYVRHHPVVVSVAVAAVLFFKGKALARLGKRAFALWRTWRVVQGALLGLGGRVRP